MSVITSSEIKNAAFEHTTFRGYNPEQVDRILDNAAETVDSLTRENAVLSEKVRALTAQIEAMRTRENTLNEIMLRAQKMHDEIVAEAVSKKEAMLSEAQTESEKMLTSAKSLYEAKIIEYKDAIRLEKTKLNDAREAAANFIEMICGEFSTQAEQIAKIKSRANIEDVETRPAQFTVPTVSVAPVVDAPKIDEPFVEPTPSALNEAIKVHKPEEKAVSPSVSSSDAVFDFSAVVDAAKNQTEQPIAVNSVEKTPVTTPNPVAQDVVTKIATGSSSAAPTAGMSWDEIIGLKSAPVTAKKDSTDSSSLKFGKEFDVTIQ